MGMGMGMEEPPSSSSSFVTDARNRSISMLKGLPSAQWRNHDDYKVRLGDGDHTIHPEREAETQHQHHQQHQQQQPPRFRESGRSSSSSGAVGEEGGTLLRDNPRILHTNSPPLDKV